MIDIFIEGCINEKKTQISDSTFFHSMVDKMIAANYTHILIRTCQNLIVLVWCYIGLCYS